MKKLTSPGFATCILFLAIRPCAAFVHRKKWRRNRRETAWKNDVSNRFDAQKASLTKIPLPLIHQTATEPPSMHFQRSLDPKPVVNKKWLVRNCYAHPWKLSTNTKIAKHFFFFCSSGDRGHNTAVTATFLHTCCWLRYAKLRVTP